MYAHGAVASRYLGSDLFHGVISEEWRTFPMDENIRGALVFLEVMTLRPEELGREDVQAARSAGLERIDLEHAVMISSMFNSMNRLVDAFGADLTEEQSGGLATMLDMAGRVTAKSTRKKDPPFGKRMPDFVEHILLPVRESEGDSPAGLRRAIEARISTAIGAKRSVVSEEELPPDLATFVDMINEDVWGLTDEDFEQLKARWSEEAIYEFVYSASMAAGLARLEVAWQVIEDGWD
jgi:hypothetical protein